MDSGALTRGRRDEKVQGSQEASKTHRPSADKMMKDKKGNERLEPEIIAYLKCSILQRNR